MSEATATTVAAPAAAAPPPAAASTAAPSAGATLTSVPTGPEWASGFKEETKAYIGQKGFKTPEDLAVSYQNLEKLRGVPEERLLKLPEKMEGDEARAIWEKLGAPKEAKGYELPRDEKTTDPKFTDWAETSFHKNNLTKTQAQGMLAAYNEFTQSQMAAQIEERKNMIAQSDATLQKEWGQHYETNLNLAKQGARILGLDGKTLDLMEALQGRESLFKTLQRIGVSVGESNFVDGKGSAAPAMTPEQAQQEIKNLMQDRKFVKQVNRGDKAALEKWNALNVAAAPGEKSIG